MNGKRAGDTESWTTLELATEELKSKTTGLCAGNQESIVVTKAHDSSQAMGMTMDLSLDEEGHLRALKPLVSFRACIAMNFIPRALQQLMM